MPKIPPFAPMSNTVPECGHNLLNDDSEDTKEKTISHGWMAELIMSKFSFLTCADTHEILYYDKNTGIFKLNVREIIQHQVEVEMGLKELSDRGTMHYVAEVIGYIHA